MDYQEMMQALEGLRKEILSYYAKNVYGEYPTVDEEALTDLKARYKDVFDKASDFLETVPEDRTQITEDMRIQYEEANDIQTLLQKDMNALDLAVPGMTFVDMIRYGNDRKIDVTGKEFKTVGDQASQRSMMTITGPDGKPLRGFFTERTFMGYEKNNVPFYIEKFSRSHPDFREFYEELIPNIFENPGRTSLPYGLKGAWKAQYPGKEEEFDDVWDELETFSKGRFISFMQGMTNLHQGDSLSPVDTRNIAMSNIARLLGMEGSLAKTTKLTLVSGEHEIEGSFMEFATGLDPSSPQKDDPFMKLKPGFMDHTPALKALSDMQVLDYICGNADRHGRNLFYKFDDRGKVVGFCGIDNDMSFSTQGADFGGGNFVGKAALYHISRSMAHQVMALNEYTVNHAIEGLGFEEANIRPVMERVNALKQMIRDGSTIIIEDKDYEQYKLSDFVPTGPGPHTFTYKDKTIEVPAESKNKPSEYWQVDSTLGGFLTMKDDKRREIEDPEYHAQKEAERHKGEPKPRHPKPEGKDSKVQLGWEKSYSLESLEVGMDVPVIADLANKVKLADRRVFFGSKEFKHVMESIDALQLAVDTYAKKGTEVSEKAARGLQAAYSRIQKVCENYLELKKEQGKLDVEPLSKTGKRITVVREAMKFCSERVAAIEEVVTGPAMDKEVHEAHKDAQTLLNESMTPKQVGDTVKVLNQMHKAKPDSATLTIRAAEQMKMFEVYMREKKGRLEDYGLTAEDMTSARELIRDGRRLNAELQQKTPDSVTKSPEKAAALYGVMAK